MSDDDPESSGERGRSEAPADGYDALAERAAGEATGDSAGDDPAGDGRPPADREGDGWASPWGDNPLQRYHSWPVTRRLLPEVAGRRVLDAGCGVGDHAAWLREEGAEVVGVDASERAVEVARGRLDDGATVHRGDLADALDFARDGEFDVILSHLVLDHVENLRPTFAEFHRALADDGALVFTVVHPMQFYLAYDAVESYYEPTPVELGWDAPVTSYHRPLGAWLGALTDAGFRLDAVEEPRPSDEYVERAADEWNVAERPQILSIRARPDSK